MYELYTINDKELNCEFDNYIFQILLNILQLPDVIIRNLIEVMNLNYQWVEIRKLYNLEDSPLDLEFNLTNYKNICKKYIPHVSICFIDVTSLNIFPSLYFIEGPEKDINKVDVVYHLNHSNIFSDLTVNNMYINISDSESILNVKKLVGEHNKEMFESYMNYIYINNWRRSINTYDYWYTEKECKEYFNELIDNPCLKGENNCLCNNINKKIIYKCNKNIRYLIKKVTAYLDCYKGSLGIIVDNKFSVCGGISPNGCFTLINIQVNNYINISKVTDDRFLNTLSYCYIIDLIKQYGNIEIEN